MCVTRQDERASRRMITQLLGAPWGRAVDFPLKGTGEQGRESQGLGDRAGAGPIGGCGWGIRQNGRVGDGW